MRGDSAFNIGASYRINGINELGAEWLTRLQLGDRQELYSEFYQPLDAGSRYFVAPYLVGEAQNVEAILDNDPIAEYRLERYGYGLNLGRQIANNELLYSFDTLDNLDFPRTGEDIGLMLRKYDRGLGSDDDYRQWQLKLDKAYSHGPNTWLFGGRYGRTLDETEVVTSGFILGGAQELSGFRQDSVSGQNMALARMIYYRRLTQNSMLPLNFPLYLGLSLERGRAWNNDNAFDSGYINAASIFLGLDTPLGPLNFSYGFNDQREKALYLNLGKSF
jgi:NTE family protein